MDAIVLFYTEDAIFMPPNDTSIYGRAELREWHEEYFQHFTIEALTETERDVQFVDGWGVERWAYSVHRP